MNCRKCKPNRLCPDCHRAVLAQEKLKRQRAIRAVQPPLDFVAPEPEPEPKADPRMPGTDAGYSYNVGRYRPGWEPRFAEEIRYE